MSREMKREMKNEMHFQNFFVDNVELTMARTLRFGLAPTPAQLAAKLAAKQAKAEKAAMVKSFKGELDAALNTMHAATRGSMIQFAAEMNLPAAPGLAVRRNADDEFRRVSLPLDDASAQLVRACAAKDVACVEFAPEEQFRFENPEWQARLDEFVAKVAVRRPELRVSSKLVLCSTGDHLVAHHAGEKMPGHYATITVQLPSRFTGGEVVVRVCGHESVHRLDETTGLAEYNCHFAMLLADVEHQLRPITSGHQLSLILTLHCEAPTPAAPTHADAAAALTAVLQRWPRDELDAIAVPLALCYENLSVDDGVAGLVAVDRPFALALREVVGQLAGGDVHVFLANAKRSHFQWTKSGDWEDQDDPKESISQVVDSSGSEVFFVESLLGSGKLASFGANNEQNFWGRGVDDEDLNPFAERPRYGERHVRYSRTVVLLVPIERDVESLANKAGFDGAFRSLCFALRDDAGALSAALSSLVAWARQRSRLKWHAADVADLLSSPATSSELARQVLELLALQAPLEIDASFIDSMMCACSTHDTAMLAPVLRCMAEAIDPLSFSVVAHVLHQLGDAPAEQLVAVIDAFGAAKRVGSTEACDTIATVLAQVTSTATAPCVGRLLECMNDKNRVACMRAIADASGSDATTRRMLIEHTKHVRLDGVAITLQLMQLCCSLDGDAQPSLVDVAVVDRVLAPECRDQLLAPLIGALRNENQPLSAACVVALKRLMRARVADLDRVVAAGEPVFSWAMPHLIQPSDGAELRAFLADRERCKTVLSGFTHRGRLPHGCIDRSSLQFAPLAGSGARASVRKLRTSHDQAVTRYEQDVEEKQQLEAFLGSSGSKRAHREVLSIDDSD